MSISMHCRSRKMDREWKRRYSTKRSCKICNISNKYIFTITSLSVYLSWFIFDENFLCFSSSLTVVFPRRSRLFSHVSIWNHMLDEHFRRSLNSVIPHHQDLFVCLSLSGGLTFDEVTPAQIVTSELNSRCFLFHSFDLSSIGKFSCRLAIRKAAKRGHCTRAEQEWCIMTE